MMTVLIIVLALMAVGGIAIVIAAKHAPLGYQDADGFHFVNKESSKRKSHALQAMPSPPQARTASTISETCLVANSSAKESVAAPDAPGPLQDDFERADWAIAPQHKKKPVEVEVLRPSRGTRS